MKNKINKQVTLNLVGLDGNAFALMGAFQKQARKEKWTKDEIQTVLDECTSGDYDHLLATLFTYCKSEEDFDNYDYDWDYNDVEEDFDERWGF